MSEMQPRYIDTERFKIWLSEKVKQRTVSWSTADTIAALLLKYAPTADVLPVVHAHWKHVGTSPGVGIVYHCSRCERQVIVDYAFMLSQYPYCHCGAKMDEEVK